MSGSRHIMILASAGSGKTYELTGRFIRHLAHGARPERIVALTFTRKAAGEFFDEILKKLAAAAIDEAGAKELAAVTGRPELRSADFLGMLRAMTEAMPRLRLGTLDSFFAQVARAFALELGLTGDFEILEKYGERLERRRVLQRMFARAGQLDEAQKDFIEDFKRATFGKETKRLGAQLDEFIDRTQEVLLTVPDAACWGRAERIWPQGSRWLRGGPVDVPLALRGLRNWLGSAGVDGKPREKWLEFIAALETWTPGTEAKPLVYVLEKVLEHWADLGAGRAELKFHRQPQRLDAPACQALQDCARHVIGGELARRLEVTRGIHAVVAGYENSYHAMVRRTGKLTFADVQRLLAPTAGAPALTRAEGAADRLFIDYRLDAEIDHWLLDEFQDTSRGQWSVLKNLIDEAVQDEAGVRSFFCVGDVKQAIYTWRAGDPRLFREILSHYTAADAGAVTVKHLTQSWRSGPALIAMVNAVFGNAAVWTELFPGPVAENWNGEWREHSSAVPERTGQAAWLHAADEEARWAVTLQLLQEIRPWERGLSCAVLVQKNQTAADLADYLRSAGGLPVMAAADTGVGTDNPLGAGLLALVQAAAHPEDTLAQEHVRMTPLGAIMQREGLTLPEAITERVLGQIHAEGFERTLEYWCAQLEPALAADDAFSRLRTRQLVAAARRFDETGSRDVAEFVAFMERHVVRESEGAGMVRVMTVHKAKGLGFDVVVLPDLEGNSLDEARQQLAVSRQPGGPAEWVLDPPNTFFCAADEVLAAYKCSAEAEAGYEAVALFYVALTRAKRAMYVITKPAGDSTARNYPRVLTETLGDDAKQVRVGALQLEGGWSAGAADWHEQLVPVPPPGVVVPGIGQLKDATIRVKPREARRPSQENQGQRNAAGIFSLEATVGAEYGAAVHGLLAEVAWGSGKAGEDWPVRGVDGAAGDEVMACLREPELAEIWRKPAGEGQVELWRERAFEVVLEQAWVTGVFDRVVVVRDGAGQVLSAVVYDFKTDKFPEVQLVAAVARHAGQINLYRRVVAVLAGLNFESVAGELVFTHLRRRVRMPVRIG